MSARATCCKVIAGTSGATCARLARGGGATCCKVGGIASGELHYCWAGASAAGKLLRQTLRRGRKRCVTCATCCEAVVQLPRAEPADARGCGLSNQPRCRQSRVHRTAWTMESRSRFVYTLSTTREMESRSLCFSFYCLCTTWSLESRSRLDYFMCSTAGSMESRSLSSSRAQYLDITLLHFDTVLLEL